jgi:diaminopimelate epimerase
LETNKNNKEILRLNQNQNLNQSQKQNQSKENAYIFSESKEIMDLSNENNRESSVSISEEEEESENNNLNDYSTDDNFQIIEKMTNEIERILIDIYNNHIKADKNKTGIDISKYERHISEISSNFDKHYNIFILQILSEKIKLLVHVYNILYLF